MGERLRMQEHPWGVVSPMAGVMPKRFGRRREDADEAISLIKEYQVCGERSNKLEVNSI